MVDLLTTILLECRFPARMIGRTFQDREHISLDLVVKSGQQLNEEWLMKRRTALQSRTGCAVDHRSGLHPIRSVSGGYR